MKLTAKEQRLCNYLVDHPEGTIGDICKALKTTPITLLSKTWPSLNAKVKAMKEQRNTETKNGAITS